MGLDMCGDQQSKHRANSAPVAKSMIRQSSRPTLGEVVMSALTSIAW